MEDEIGEKTEDELECDIISRVTYARLMEWGRKLIPEMRWPWCVAKWPIGDF